METWLSGWTIFYWAWWISWTPFVGMFIARISRGRTIRGFVAGVILIPGGVSLVWFGIFGGAAITAERNGADLAALPVEGQLFGLLDTLPLGSILGVIAMTLVAIFFVSGADAASIVMGTLSQRGTIHPDRKVVVFWGAMMGGIAALMLMVGGSDALSGIQNITIIMAAPFLLVMIVMCIALMKDLRSDPLVQRGRRVTVVMEQAVDYGMKEHGDEFFLNVKPNECEPALGSGSKGGSPPSGSAANGAVVTNGGPPDNPLPPGGSPSGRPVASEGVSAGNPVDPVDLANRASS